MLGSQGRRGKTTRYQFCSWIEWTTEANHRDLVSWVIVVRGKGKPHILNGQI
jgi:hypothetical protein